MTPEITKLLQDTIELLNGVLFQDWRDAAKDIARRAKTILQTEGAPADAKILIYHGKHGDEIYLANTPERLAAAQKELFNSLDDQGCYWGCGDNSTKMLAEARDGDPRAIQYTLEARQDYEYEAWELVNAIDATKPQR
jgi:hypothetical protein